MDKETKEKHETTKEREGQLSLNGQMNELMKEAENKQNELKIAPSLYLKTEETLPNYVILKIETIIPDVGKNNQTLYQGILYESNVSVGSIRNDKNEYVNVPVNTGDLISVWGTSGIDKELNKEENVGKVFNIRVVEKIKLKNGRSFWKTICKDVTNEDCVRGMAL